MTHFLTKNSDINLVMIKETQLTIPHPKNPLRATLIQPRVDKKKHAAVLFMHGWAGNRNEIGDIYLQIAHRLAEVGITSLRFDFYGCGESQPQVLKNLTITGMLRDAKVALQFLQEHLLDSSNSIGLCGFSVGSAVMGLLIQEYHLNTGGHVPSVVALSPIVNLTQDLSYRHRALIEKMLNKSPDDNEFIEYNLGWRIIPVRPAFVREFEFLDKALNISWKNYRGACLAIGGELDFSGENVKQFNKTAPNAGRLKQLFLPETDHGFNVFADKNNQMPMVTSTVIDWFSETLL